MEMKSCPTSTDHASSALVWCLSWFLCIASTAIMTNRIWHVCMAFIPRYGEGLTVTPALVSGRARPRCWVLQGGGWLGGSVTGKDARSPRSPLWCLHKSGSCSFPTRRPMGFLRCFQPDLDNAGKLHVFSKGFWVRPFFFKSFFSLSSSSYLAACPTGLDGPFYEQAKWGQNPFCPRLPANQQ